MEVLGLLIFVAVLIAIVLFIRRRTGKTGNRGPGRGNNFDNNQH